MIFLKTGLVNKDEVVVNRLLHSVDVFAPLPQPFHLQRHVQVFLPLGFDNDRFACRIA